MTHLANHFHREVKCLTSVFHVAMSGDELGQYNCV